MNKITIYLLLFISIFFSACDGGSSNKAPLPKIEKTIILDNDVWDSDNYNTPIIGAYLSKRDWNVVVLQTESTQSNSSSCEWIKLLNIYDKDKKVSYGLSKDSNDRALPPTKANKHLSNCIPDSAVGNAYNVLTEALEKAEDLSVRYATGGKLIFLSNYLKNPYHLQLFKLKVTKIYFGLGCDITNNNSCKDFNLAMNDKSWRATKEIYSKLHGIIPFVVGSAKYGKQRVYDYFKTTANDATIIYGNGTYGNFGDISLGDIDIFLPAGELAKYTVIKGNISLGNKRFLFKKGKGSDELNIINDDIVGIVEKIIK